MSTNWAVSAETHAVTTALAECRRINPRHHEWPLKRTHVHSRRLHGSTKKQIITRRKTWSERLMRPLTHLHPCCFRLRGELSHLTINSCVIKTHLGSWHVFSLEGKQNPQRREQSLKANLYLYASTWSWRLRKQPHSAEFGFFVRRRTQKPFPCLCFTLRAQPLNQILCDLQNVYEQINAEV